MTPLAILSAAATSGARIPFQSRKAAYAFRHRLYRVRQKEGDPAHRHLVIRIVLPGTETPHDPASDSPCDLLITNGVEPVTVLARDGSPLTIPDDDPLLTAARALRESLR